MNWQKRMYVLKNSRSWNALALFIVAFFLFGVGKSFGQIGPAFPATGESDYQEALPLFGKGMAQNFDLPFPIGVNLNIIYGVQNTSINNTLMRIGDGPEFQIDDLVEFGKLRSDVQTVNFQLDAWVLPFVNVYGMVGFSNSGNDLEINSPFTLEKSYSNSGSFYGFGAEVAGTFGPLYAGVESNWTYTQTKFVDAHSQRYSTTFRVGPSLGFKEKPNRNLTVWLGGDHIIVEGNTSGSLSSSDVLPSTTDEIDALQTQLDNWYAGLSDADQKAYQVQYDEFSDLLNGAEAGTSEEIAYSTDRSFDSPWGLVIGGRYQFSQRFQVEGEAKILGDMSSGQFSLIYRMGTGSK